MAYNFDEIIERRGTGSIKWEWYEDDVLPLWVADMDFRSPDVVMDAIRERTEHGVFGYGFAFDDLRAVIAERMTQRYHWHVDPTQMAFTPGLVSALSIISHMIGTSGDGVLMANPIYYPFITTTEFNKRVVQMATTPITCEDNILRAEIDFDAFEDTITPETKLFLLCNPHNPVGRVYTHTELERLAEICLRHDLIICADEIHSDLLFDDHRHIPMATIAPEVAEKTITLIAPSKTFNIAGLKVSAVITQNEDLLKQMTASIWGMGLGCNVLGVSAAVAAYRDGQAWLDALLAYLQANRDYVVDTVRETMPAINITKPEGTYLAWLDCREAGIPGNPHEFFLKEARVGMNDGATFGSAGEGFVRLNFGSPRVIIEDALSRMAAALENTHG